MWNEFEGSVARLIRHCYEKRETMYLDSIKTMLSCRGSSSWDINSYFLSKESFAMLFERARFLEEAYVEYLELETVFVECAESSDPRDLGDIDFGGSCEGDEICMFTRDVLDPKLMRTALSTRSATELMLRQYLFSRQAKFLIRLGRTSAVLQRGIAFIQTIASALGAREGQLRPYFREAWTYSSCLELAAFAGDTLKELAKDFATTSKDGMFLSRCRGDLLCYARVELAVIGEALGLGRTLNASAGTSMSETVMAPPSYIGRRGSAAASSPSSSPFRRLTAALSHRQNLSQHQAPAEARSLEEELYSIEVKSKAKATAVAIASGIQQMTLDDDDDDDDNDDDNGDGGGGGQESSTGADGDPAHTDCPQSEISREEAALKFMSWTSNEELRASLTDGDAFEKTLIDLAVDAARCFRSSSRNRQAAQLDLEVADLHIARRRYESAAVFLKQSLPIYRIEGWEFISIKVYERLRLCFREMNEHEHLASTCLKLLSICVEKRHAESLLGLQDEFISSSSQLTQESFASVDGDLKSLICAQNVVNVTRMHSLPDACASPVITADDVITFEVDFVSFLPKTLSMSSVGLQLKFADAEDAEDVSLVDCLYQGGGVETTSSGDDGQDGVLLQPGPNRMKWRAHLPLAGKYYLDSFSFRVGLLGVSFPISASDSRGFNLLEMLNAADTPQRAIYVCDARPQERRLELSHILESAATALVPGEEQYVGIVITPLRDLMADASVTVEDIGGDSVGLVSSGSRRAYVLRSGEVLRNVIHGPNGGTSGIDWAPETALQLPEWTARQQCTVWFAVKPDASAASSVQLVTSVSFGKERRVCERSTFDILVIDPFKVSVNLAPTDTAQSMGVEDGGTNSQKLILQMSLESRIALPLLVHDATIELQQGFGPPVDVCKGMGVFPIRVSPVEESASILYVVDALRGGGNGDEGDGDEGKSTLVLKYTIETERLDESKQVFTCADELSKLSRSFTFRFDATATKRPFEVHLLEPPHAELGVPLRLEWRIVRTDRVADDDANFNSLCMVPYQISMPAGDDWLLSGEIRGHFEISKSEGASTTVSCFALPMRAGDVKLPRIHLVGIEASGNASVSENKPLVLRVRPSSVHRTTTSQICTT